MDKLIKSLLEKIGEDPQREGLRETPKRVAESLRFLTSGYSKIEEDILNGALFDVKLDEMIMVRDVDIFSLCEHHLLPFFGKCHIAYIPNKKIVGLSKIPRIVEIYSRRLQLQERLTEQIANSLWNILNPLGVAVVIEARHLCMIMRGVEKQNAVAVTSSMKGEFKTNGKTRGEFLRMIGRLS